MGERVRREVDHLRLPNVFVEDAVPPHRVRARISQCMVYVLPAENEPFGLTIVEAMAAGRPVVIASSGGLAPDVERAKAGLVYPGSVPELVSAVEELLKNEARAIAMGCSAYELARERFSIEAVSSDLLRRYEAMVRERSKRRHVLWLTNVAAPYRVPVWKYLSNRVALTVALLETNVRLAHDASANRGSDWLASGCDGYAVSQLRTLRMARGEARYYFVSGRLPMTWDSILIGGWESPAYWQALLLAKIMRRRAVGFYESTLLTQRHKDGAIGWARRRFYRSLDAVVVPGRAAEAAVIEMGIDRSRVHVGFNAVDVMRIRDAVASCPQPVGPGHHYLYVGQLIDRKGVDLFLQAFAAVRVAGDRAIVVGVGESEAELRELTRRLGLGSVVAFAGYVSHDELPSIIARSQTLVMPSREEVWGLVANEGLAGGLHVIVSSVAGVTPSICHMRGVLVCEPELGSVSTQMRISREQWAGRIANPEILRYGPDEFADVFYRALIDTPKEL